MSVDIPPIPSGLISPEFQVWWQQVSENLKEQFDLNDEVVEAINIALRNAGIALDAAQQDMPTPPALTVASGDLPETVQFYRYEDGSDVTGDAEWSAAVESGDADVEIGAATGLLTINSATVDSVIRVTSIRADTAMTAIWPVRIIAPGSDMAQDWSLTFTANGDQYIAALEAMTIDAGNAEIGTGTLAYAKSTNAAPSTFSATSLPTTLEAGAWLKITVSAIAGFKAVHLKRTA